MLATEAQALGGIATVRSLGRAGYPVHACASEPDALGLRSRYAAARVVCPPYDDAEFVPWLSGYVAQHHIRAIVPSEGFLLGVRAKLTDFAQFLPASPHEDILFRGLSKVDTHEALAGVTGYGLSGGHLPPTLIVEDGGPLPDWASLARLGEPLYIKVDACHGHLAAPGGVYPVRTAAEAHSRLPEILRHYRKALIQGHVPGQGVGAFFLLWNGKVVAEFMHQRLHEVPHTGGVSSLRASWWHPAIRDDALAKLAHLRWQGVAMMEYRWDAGSDTFHFIEMNGRFWGSLHLALFAGVDFPVLLLDSFLGRRVDPVTTFPVGLRCRYTVPKEIQYVWSRLGDSRLPVSAQAWSVFEFVLLSLDPRVKSDLLFPGDSALYWRRLTRFLRTLG